MLPCDVLELGSTARIAKLDSGLNLDKLSIKVVLPAPGDPE